MITRQEAIEFCLTFPRVYEDYPFDDPNWTVMRRKDTKRGFAWIFERDLKIWINVKNLPEDGILLREVFPSVIPAYHMNKLHWSSIILDGMMNDSEIQRIISESYRLCGVNNANR